MRTSREDREAKKKAYFFRLREMLGDGLLLSHINDVELEDMEQLIDVLQELEEAISERCGIKRGGLK